MVVYCENYSTEHKKVMCQWSRKQKLLKHLTL